MPFCQNCGNNLPENSCFCNVCGRPVQTQTATIQQPTYTQQPVYGNQPSAPYQRYPQYAQQPQYAQPNQRHTVVKAPNNPGVTSLINALCGAMIIIALALITIAIVKLTIWANLKESTDLRDLEDFILQSTTISDSTTTLIGIGGALFIIQDIISLIDYFLSANKMKNLATQSVNHSQPTQQVRVSQAKFVAIEVCGTACKIFFHMFCMIWGITNIKLFVQSSIWGELIPFEWDWSCLIIALIFLCGSIATYFISNTMKFKHIPTVNGNYPGNGV